MDRSQEAEQDTQAEKPGRGWSTRFTGTIRYRRFTDIDAGGRRSIFFKFEQPHDGEKLPQEVWDILHDMKHIDRGVARGGGLHSTGLEFNRSKKHGRVWRLPNSQTGRTTADIIDMRLLELAERLDNDPSKAR